MFRPTRSRSRLGYVPLRLAAAVFVLFAVLLALAVGVGMQFERSRLVAEGVPMAPEGSLVIIHGLTGGTLLKVLGALLVLAAAGILFFTTFQNYRAITQTFERVKSYMYNILQSIPTGVLTLDARGTVTSLNSAGERLLSLRASGIVGRPVGDVLQAAPELIPWIRTALTGSQLVHESDLALTVSGTRRVVMRASASELKDEAGRADGLVVLLRDITEVNRLEQQLRRSDKLAALGTLSAGVAHEVKNPLHALSLNLHLLEHEVAAAEPSVAEVKGYFEVLRSELQRLQRIVDNFLRFSLPSIPEVKPLDLNALAERVVSLVSFEAADHGVTIETHFDRSLGAVPGDEGQLSQVVLNLVMNAFQAMPNGGALVLSLRRHDEWAEVTVKDSGDGIPKDIMPHIFDPYFTTHPGGAGLGLAIAHRIIEGHHGTIDVESEPGTGTTMVVRLPLDHPGPARET